MEFVKLSSKKRISSHKRGDSIFRPPVGAREAKAPETKEEGDAGYLPGRERSIRAQWLFSNLPAVVMVLLVAVIVFCVATYSLQLQAMRSNLVSRVSTSTAFFNKYANASYSELLAGAKLYVEGYTDKDVVELQVLDTSGKLLYSSSGLLSGTRPQTNDLIDALRTNTASVWRGEDPASGEYVMAVSSPIIFPSGEIAAVVRCVSSMQTISSRMLLYGVVAAVVALVILGFVVLSNLIFIRSIVQPLQQITETTRLIAQGRYGVHIVPLYANEIGTLCNTINDMSDAISRAEQTKNDFISSVSHELRTPLTAIGGWSETLLTGGMEDQAEVRHGLEIIRGEASRLTRMVEELLDFSRMESGELTMQMEKADIAPDIEDVVFMYMDTIRKEGITLEFHEDDELPPVVCDRARMRQVLLNILDNARKHGGDGKRIIVAVEAQEHTISVAVRDFGQGISPEELPHVRDRFYKGHSKARGNGIGLAVADEIVRVHGGRLDIESVLGEGTCVTIVLPVSQS